MVEHDEDLEFLRAMQAMGVGRKRPKKPSAAEQATAARGAVAESDDRGWLQQQEAEFAAHMAGLAAGTEPTGGEPEPEVDTVRASSPRAADPEPGWLAAQEDTFARYMADVDAGRAPVQPEPRVETPPPAAAMADGGDQATAGAEPETPPAPTNPLLHGSERALRRRLKRGEIAPAAELDLHRKNRGEAIGALDSFLKQSQQAGHEIVLVITGRGKHSADLGVLKEMVPLMLQRRWPGIVRQTLVATPNHGGEGAYVVLLRRA